MQSAVSEECTAIAFYGIRPPKNAMASVYRQVLGWFERYGRSADAAAADGPGHSGKTTAFRQVDAKLRETGFEKIQGFSLCSLLPNARIPMDDYALSASISFPGSYFVARCAIIDCAVVRE